MKILLIEQVKTKAITTKPFEKMILTLFSILPSLYPRRISAITPDEHKITLINERYHHIPYDSSFDIVVIHFNTAAAMRAYEISDTFRKKKIPVVLCGLHATAMIEEASAHADSILLGRSETNWIHLLKDMENGLLQKIYPVDPYEMMSVTIPPTRVVLPGLQFIAAIEATRGCPFGCIFCPEATTVGNNRFFARPVDEVIDEIRSLPQKIFMFYDLSLTIDPKYTKELFQKMRSLRKRFICNGNIDVLAADEELVKLSQKAGCIGWLIGFESVSQETLSSVGKNTNKVLYYKKAVDLIHRYRMAVIGDFMFGFDTDTPDVFHSTLSTIRSLGIDVADFSILTPFPGTPLFKTLESQERILTKDWGRYTMHSVVFQPKQMNPAELINGVTMLYHEFYAPLYSLKRMGKGLRLGMYPLLLILGRSIIASFGMRNLKTSKNKVL